jgi:hypothetical protein
MKKIFRVGMTAMLVLSMLTLSISVVPQEADAAVANWQTGASIQSRFAQDFGSDSFKQSVTNLKNNGANFVTLIIPYYQSNGASSDIQPGWNTPSDESLIAAINYIHSQGMKVMLKPHIDSYDGSWRAYISPWDRNAWFANYATILNHLADIGAQTGVEQICVGAELISLATYTSNGDNTQRWQNLIAGVRSRFGGALTYSANWGSGDFADEKAHIGFWPQLDYIGISAYFNLYGNNDVGSLKNAWDGYNWSQIKPLADQHGKPILFTEIGYRSVSGAHNEPWNYSMGGGYDPQEQVHAYAALFDYWNNHNYMVGVHIWDWSSDPAAGGNGNTDYTPQNKPAEATIKQWFTGSASPTPPTSTTTPPTGTSTPPTGNTSVNGSFTVSGDVSPNPGVVNQSMTLSPTVAISGTASNVIVDVEVYNSSNTQVFQKFFEGESFTTNQSKNYSIPWTPTNTGTYKMTVGVFNNNWTQNYIWNEVKTFNVNQTGTTPPATTTPTTTPPTNSGNPSTATYSASATMNPNPGVVNQSTTVTPSITANTDLSGILVDAEIYNSSGTRVFQQFFENQSFTSNTAKNFNLAWTPATSGNHTLKLGLFSNTWSQNYYWNDAVTTLPVNTSGTNNPPPPATTTPTTTPPTNPPTNPNQPTGTYNTNIWWPTDGASVSGVLPFKAMLEGLDVSQYQMYWQVDGGTLNEMFNSSQDYPHKESLVDVSGWTWQGSGNYLLNFVSKNSSGATLSTKSVNIKVTH